MSINVAIIRESFETAKPLADQIMIQFYENLFTDFPASKPLFSKVDMKNQQLALLKSLVTAIDNLDNPDTLIKYLLGLGERHARYEVEDYHYDWVGQSLLKTFGQFLGAKWTDELREQWTEVFGVLAQVMKKGAKNAVCKKVTPIGIKDRANTKDNPTEHWSLDSEIPPLSDELKETIRLAVKDVVRRQIKAEVKKWLEEEMREIARMSPEDLLRKAG